MTASAKSGTRQNYQSQELRRTEIVEGEIRLTGAEALEQVDLEVLLLEVSEGLARAEARVGGVVSGALEEYREVLLHQRVDDGLHGGRGGSRPTAPTNFGPQKT